MATTQRTSPGRVFMRRVWTNPDVCCACFARIRRDDRRVLAGESGHDVVDKGAHGEVATRDEDGRVDGAEPVQTHSAKRDHVHRTFCAACGSRSGRADDDPLSTRTAISRVPQLHERLVEQGIDVDMEAMSAAVRVWKRRDDLQGFDSEMWAYVTAIGVRRA